MMMRMQLVELSQQKNNILRVRYRTYAHAINMQACVEPKLNLRCGYKGQFKRLVNDSPTTGN